MSEYRTIHDPFLGKDVQISDNLTDRLRGKYANGPMLPNGEPEFGWRQFDTPPIQHRAADRIDALVKALTNILDASNDRQQNRPRVLRRAHRALADPVRRAAHDHDPGWATIWDSYGEDCGMSEPLSAEQQLEERVDRIISELDEFCALAANSETVDMLDAERVAFGQMQTRIQLILSFLIANPTNSG